MTAPDGDALLTRLNALFEQDPHVDEIGLLFGIEAEELTVETAFILEEHKLGVAFSAGPLVFKAARNRFHQLNPLLHSKTTAEEEDRIRHELLQCTRVILLISADFYTAWNTRKEFVKRGWLEAAQEVVFCNLIFTLHPKSIDTWAYRRWLATRLCAELEDDALAVFYQQQVDLCTILTERYARNYHAWSFRHWTVSKFNLTQLEQELQVMQHWCETHITDHSGWNHRQHTLKCLLKRLDGDWDRRKGIVADEYKLLSSIMAQYPTHEALWCHRRFVSQTILQEFVSSEDPECQSALVDVTSIQGGADSQELSSAVLSEKWTEIEQTLRNSDIKAILPAILQDVRTSWFCNNRFARRYALWVVARLARFVGDKTQLAHLDSSMRAALITDDALLDHLWQQKTRTD
ncbi:hypothetical protein Poli38472_010090 [Pythium oligandrum]|uniref:Uncharacterized protein n=1 Tax=Pythium oligandrum TaxID=41045 RepID=A0A8K1FDM7_PYTOL|nr:hypothetical protein Poli38472_010090 [Pythium oligandrum]|eukprot:TMW58531.1 hypothetical protein Poli38472_010090 [Pythium oligandrum]